MSKKKGTQKPDAMHICIVAEQYFNASKWLYSAKERNFPKSVSMAGVTCAAFSLELFFKSLLVHEGGQLSQTHDLKKLFHRLKGSTQNAIRQKFQKYLPDIINQIAPGVAEQGVKMPTVDFDFVLELSRDAFEQIRYVYEGLPLNAGWLADGILMATRQLVFEAHPTWKAAEITSPKIVSSRHRPAQT